MVGLELWMLGTRDELTAAIAALGDAGRLIQQGIPQPLAGADTGRHRLYLRLAIATTSHAERHPAPPPAPAGGVLVDLAAARAHRRPA